MGNEKDTTDQKELDALNSESTTSDETELAELNSALKKKPSTTGQQSGTGAENTSAELTGENGTSTFVSEQRAQKKRIDNNTYITPAPKKSTDVLLKPTHTKDVMAMLAPKENLSQQQTSQEKQAEQQKFTAEQNLGALYGEPTLEQKGEVSKKPETQATFIWKPSEASAFYAGYVNEWANDLKQTDPDEYAKLLVRSADFSQQQQYNLIKKAIEWKYPMLERDVNIYNARGYDKIYQQYQDNNKKIQQLVTDNKLEQYINIVTQINTVMEAAQNNPNATPEEQAAYQTQVQQLQTQLQGYDIPHANSLLQQVQDLQQQNNEFKATNQDAIDKYEQVQKQIYDLDYAQKKALNDFPEVREKLYNQEMANISAKLGLPGSTPMDEAGKTVWNKVVDSGLGLIEFASSFTPESPVTPNVDWDKVKEFSDDYLKFTAANTPFVTKEGDINWYRALPAVSGTLTDMAILLYGANKFTAPFKAAGLSESLASNAGLFSSSLVQTYADYKQQALDAGYNEADANIFALSSASLTSLLEMVSPNSVLRGTAVEKDALSAALKTLNPNKAAKLFFELGIKEPFKEVSQEVLQGYADKVAAYFANQAQEGKTVSKLDETMTQGELFETVLLTYATTVIAGGGMKLAQDNTEKNAALYRAAQNYPKFKEIVAQQVNAGQLTADDAKNILAQAEKAVLALQKMPKQLTEDKKQQLMPLLEQKIELENTMKEADKSFKPLYQKDIDTLEKQIQEIANVPFEAGEKRAEEKAPEEKPEVTPVKPEPKDVTMSEEDLIDWQIAQETGDKTTIEALTKKYNINDNTNIIGLPGKEPIGPQPEQTGTELETGKKEISHGGVVQKEQKQAPKEIAGLKVIEEAEPLPDGTRIFKVEGDRFLTADGKEVIAEKQVEKSTLTNPAEKEIADIFIDAGVPKNNAEKISVKMMVRNVPFEALKRKSVYEMGKLLPHVPEAELQKIAAYLVQKKDLTLQHGRQGPQQIKPLTGTVEKTEGEAGNLPSKQKVKRIGLTGRTPKAKRKIRNPRALEALAKEPVSPYHLALQYFIGGGMLHPSALQKFYGGAGKSIAGEMRSRIGMLNKKSGKGIDEIAHILWEENNDLLPQYETADYRNAIEEVINSHMSTRSMIDELLETYVSPEEEYYRKTYGEIPADLLPESMDEMEDYWDKLSDEQLQELAAAMDLSQEEFDKKREQVGEKTQPFGPENVEGADNLTIFEPDEQQKKQNTYKTKEGEEIPYTSLAEQEIINFPEEGEVQREGGEAKGYTYRLSENEFCWTERKLSEVKNLSLTGEAKIKSSADVAYLFRHLENAATENAFVVLHKSNGSYVVLYLSTGATTATVIDQKLVYAAAKEFGATSVTFVHNHPSGNLKPSQADMGLYKALSELFETGGLKVNPAVIINLDSGLYTEFTHTREFQEKRPEKAKKEIRVKTVSFDKQVLYTPSAERKKITSAKDVAEFVSSQKRGMVPKTGIIILNSRAEITRYLMEGELSDTEMADKIIENVGKSGESVILVTNGKFNASKIQTLTKILKSSGINLLDAIETTDAEEIVNNYVSYNELGRLEEPEEKYGSDFATAWKKTLGIANKEGIEKGLEALRSTTYYKTLSPTAQQHLEKRLTENVKTKPVEKKPAAETAEGEEKGKRAVFARLVSDESKLQEAIKEKIRNKGLDYDVFGNDEQVAIAKALIKQNGLDEMVAEASKRSSYLHPAIRTAIFGEAMDFYHDQEQKAQTDLQKEYWADKQVDADDALDTMVREFGQGVQAVSRLYKMSALGLQRKVLRDLKKYNEEQLREKDREKIAKAERELERIRAEFEKQVKEKVEAGIKEELEKHGEKLYGKETRAKIKNAIQSLKIKAAGENPTLLSEPAEDYNAFNNAYNASLDEVLKAIDAGAPLGMAIQAGVDHINKNFKGKWDQREYEDKLNENLKDTGVRKKRAKLPKESEDEMQKEQVVALNKLFPKKRRESEKKRLEDHERIVKAFNAGVIGSEFEMQFKEKFGLVDTQADELLKQLNEFSQRIAKAPANSVYQAQEYMKMLDWIENQKKTKAYNYLIPVFYAHIFADFATHINNLQYNLQNVVMNQLSLMVGKDPKMAVKMARIMAGAEPGSGGFGRGLREALHTLTSGFSNTQEKIQARQLLDRKAGKNIATKIFFGHDKMIQRGLRSEDALFNVPLSEVKSLELIKAEALKRKLEANEKLPVSEQRSKKEIKKEVHDTINEIALFTEERLQEAKKQAFAEAKKLYDLADDFILTDAKGKETLNPNYKSREDKMAFDMYRRRVFEIMEQSRAKEFPQQVEEAKKFASASLLMGQPKGHAGALSIWLSTLGQGLPVTKFFVGTVVNVPLNAANAMIERSPLGFLKLATYWLSGKITGEERGAFINPEWAKRHGLDQNVSANEKKDLLIKASTYSLGLLSLGALSQLEFTDPCSKKKRKYLQITGDLTGDYGQNEILKKESGNEHLREYSVFFNVPCKDPVGFSYKYSPFAPLFAPIGYYNDYTEYKNGDAETLHERVAISTVGYMKGIYDQAALQSFHDLFSFADAKAGDDATLVQQWEKYLSKTTFKIAKNVVFPNWLPKQYDNMKGIMDAADSRPTETYQVLFQDIPFLDDILRRKYDHFGRPISSKFYLPLAGVPYKGNIPEGDKAYTLINEKGFRDKLHYYNEKTVYDPKTETEVDLTATQLDELNRVRGQYVLGIIESEEPQKTLGGKTFYDAAKELSNEQFADIMTRLFFLGTLYAKDELFGQGQWKTPAEKKEADTEDVKKDLYKYMRITAKKEGLGKVK